MTARLHHETSPSVNVPAAVGIDTWIRRIVLPLGDTVLIRPLALDDDAHIRSLLLHVTPQDRRLRFFSTIKNFSDDFIHRLTNFDRGGAMAFIALDEATGDPLGVVRIHYEGSEQGEFAVLLRSDSHGRGLGWILMKQIIEFAGSIGLKRVVGQVLQENRVMIEMCRELGFAVTTNRGDRGVRSVSLILAA